MVASWWQMMLQLGLKESEFTSKPILWHREKHWQ